jgi:predicted AlkP superfamily phosphohydrolase/phosphomutase
MAKVVVVGLDGLNPELVDRWIDELPNMARMQSDGIWGPLESTVPPITPQAWTCAQSSKNPGAIGFWDFAYRDDYVYGEPKLVDSSLQIRANPLYKRLSDMGKRTAIINVPVSYPPQPVQNGYVITSFMTPSLDKQFTHPPELRDEVSALVGEYLIDASTSEMNFRQMDKDLVLERIYRMDTQRFELLKHFIREKDCDYVFCVIMGTDRMPHLFYRYFDEKHVHYDPDPKYANALKDHYKFCDRQIGEVRDLLSPETALIVHSDHSVQRLDGRVNLNEWLLREGYLVLHERPSRLTPLRDCRVDWMRSKAWATGYTGQIYLNMRGREPQGIVRPQDYHRLLDELVEKLSAIPSPNGTAMDSRMLKRVNIHSGPYSRFGPDLFTIFDDYRYNISELVGYQNGAIHSYDTTKGPDDGGHGPYGYYCIAGPGVPSLGKIAGPSLLDIAPTVMSLLALDVPTDMEGKSLLSRREDGAYTDDDVEEIRARLAGFGYL